MLYAIIAFDIEDSQDKRAGAREEHLARLDGLQDEGRLVMAGTYPGVDASDPGEAGYKGSLIVAEFEELDAAHAWAQADPYVQAGVYEKVVVLPFKQVYPR